MHSTKFLAKRLAVFLLLLSLVSCSNKIIETKELHDNTVVWQYSDYLNRKVFPIQAAVDPTNFLMLQIGGSSAFPPISYPIIGRDYIITMDRYGVISKKDAESQKKILWKNDPKHYKLNISGSYLNGGLSVSGDKLFATYGANIICAINVHTGELLWSKDLQELVRSYPIVSDDILFLQTLTNGIYAICSKTGDVIWYNAGSEDSVNVMNVTSPVVYDNRLIIQDNIGNLFVINKETGFEEWTLNTNDSRLIDFGIETESSLIYQPIRVNDALYFYSSDGYFYKLNLQTKEVIWKENFDNSGPFYISGNTIVIVDEMNNLLAINAKNGHKLWSTKLDKHLIKKEKNKRAKYWNPPIVIAGDIYVLSSNGDWLSFNLVNGKFIKALQNADYKSYVRPIFTGKKTLFVSSKKLF
jgi:outer membrane protein assembly factor BamB